MINLCAAAANVQERSAQQCSSGVQGAQGIGCVRCSSTAVCDTERSAPQSSSDMQAVQRYAE